MREELQSTIFVTFDLLFEKKQEWTKNKDLDTHDFLKYRSIHVSVVVVNNLTLKGSHKPDRFKSDFAILLFLLFKCTGRFTIWGQQNFPGIVFERFFLPLILHYYSTKLVPDENLMFSKSCELNFVNFKHTFINLYIWPL